MKNKKTKFLLEIFISFIFENDYLKQSLLFRFQTKNTRLKLVVSFSFWKTKTKQQNLVFSSVFKLAAQLVASIIVKSFMLSTLGTLLYAKYSVTVNGNFSVNFSVSFQYFLTGFSTEIPINDFCSLNETKLKKVQMHNFICVIRARIKLWFK